jgi:hypothetical protein
MTTSEVQALESEPTSLTLSNGISVSVNRLKTRETLKLLKILTRGAGYALSSIDLKNSAEDFSETLVMAAVFAIPEAENETIDFLRAMVIPEGLNLTAKTKAARAENEELIEALDDYLSNPELDDLLDIISEIIKQEAPHLQELGKKMALLLKNYRPEKS